MIDTILAYIQSQFAAMDLTFSWTNLIEISIIVAVLYAIYRKFIKDTQSEKFVKGAFFLVFLWIFSEILIRFDLKIIGVFLKSIVTLIALSLIVIFQPELRRALESLGRSKFFKGSLSKEDKSKAQEITREFVEALLSMSDTKTGALIVIERQTALTDICETGTEIDSKVTAQLIGNIFYEGAPLHDGAVIVRGDRLHSAGCVLPLTSNQNLPKELGTRHRAGIGITEVSDAISLIVSEETGFVSVARDGRLYSHLSVNELRRELQEKKQPEAKSGKFRRLKGILKNEKKADQ